MRKISKAYETLAHSPTLSSRSLRLLELGRVGTESE